MSDFIFEFKKGGNPSGFAACADKEFIFKPDKYSAIIFPLEILKNNLRFLVKSKQAKLIKAGDTEAVAVPKELFLKLLQ